MNTKFSFSHTPELIFGVGSINILHDQIIKFGKEILLLIGGGSFKNSLFYKSLLEDFKKTHIHFFEINVTGEPTIDFIDNCCDVLKKKEINCVVSIGGGSVIDAGKAISAMLLLDEPIAPYLEGGNSFKKHPGTKIPFIAVPTTAGTGSEATKNAVIGGSGFKRSLRHDNLIPEIALIDPELQLSCPQSVTSASGIDAFTQLFESYVSTKANPITEALALQGLRLCKDSLMEAYYNGSNIQARSNMALAAYLSGVTLANAGLGAVHGFASTIGGMFNIPHGVICGTLLGAVNRENCEKLMNEDQNNDLYQKYIIISKLLTNEADLSSKLCITRLCDMIDEMIYSLGIPLLGKFGLEKSHVPCIVENTNVKNNPFAFSESELTKVLISRL